MMMKIMGMMRMRMMTIRTTAATAIAVALPIDSVFRCRDVSSGSSGPCLLEAPVCCRAMSSVGLRAAAFGGLNGLAASSRLSLTSSRECQLLRKYPWT